MRDQGHSTSPTPDGPTPVSGAARLQSVGSTVLLILGTLLVLEAALTVLWQEPLSMLYANRARATLEEEWRREVASSRGREGWDPLPALAADLERRARPGRAIGRLSIGKLGFDGVVVFGTGTATLRRGPGLFTDKAMPGGGGTTAIAGHRTTYSAPFRDIDRLRRGDGVTLEMPYGRFTYRVEGVRIVSPRAVWVIRDVDHDRLVLTACHPLHSAAQRLVVTARLQSASVAGGARSRAARRPARRPARTEAARRD